MKWRGWRSIMGEASNQQSRLDEPLWESCPKCIEHFYIDNPSLVHAFASVGIEYGKSSFEMAETYFDQYHKAGHKDVK